VDEEMKRTAFISNKKDSFANLVKDGVKKLKNFGFVNVTAENILSDEVYVFFFIRFLDSKKGKNNELDKQIEMLLCLIKEKI
jgi:hypothetical protein